MCCANKLPLSRLGMNVFILNKQQDLWRFHKSKEKGENFKLLSQIKLLQQVLFSVTKKRSTHATISQQNTETLECYFIMQTRPLHLIGKDAECLVSEHCTESFG